MEWLPVSRIIQEFDPYDPFYDFNCDGVISAEGDDNELDQFFANFYDPDLLEEVCTGAQEDAGGGQQEESEDAESNDGIEEVAESIINILDDEALEAFIARLLEAAEAYEGTELGVQCASLAEAME
jgi:hypothetical protein